MSNSELNQLSIGEMVRATGVSEATLRAWERRFGFPEPRRLASGHRRYGADDVEQVERVLEERRRGLELSAAIRIARSAPPPAPSIFARMRAIRPDLQPITIRKHHLIALTRAIEDESLARAERTMLIASFQRARFYRQSEARWRDLARGADEAFVFADFRQLRRPRGGPVEVPIARDHPASREWAVICHAPDHGACLIGFEPPGRVAPTDGDRQFEVIWSVDPPAVALAVEVAGVIAAAQAPELAETTRERLNHTITPPTPAQLQLASAITARTLARLN